MNTRTYTQLFPPLVERIVNEATVEGTRILRIDHFLNHRIEPGFMAEMGQALAQHLKPYTPDLLLTAEASGIAPALATAFALGVPVVYAKKYSPVAGPSHFSVVNGDWSPRPIYDAIKSFIRLGQ